MDPNLLILVVAFFSIALIYSSVGFGGGSSYIALLAVMGLHFEVIRPAALLCNVIVVTGGTFIFWKSGALDLKRGWPFLLMSIPMAFVGGLWKIRNESFFFILLGLCLIVAALLLWVQSPARQTKQLDTPLLNGALGGGIGFLSGLIGIGGGIFLSPILNFINWGDPKKISGLASVFILANSLSGLAGQVTKGPHIDWAFITPLLVAVFFGGQVGSRMGAKKLNPLYIKRITALLIFVAAIKILRDHL